MGSCGVPAKRYFDEATGILLDSVSLNFSGGGQGTSFLFVKASSKRGFQEVLN